MSKIFAKVNGLHEIFDTSVNDLGQTVYDTSKLKDDVLSNHNINENTIFYIKTDDVDNQLDYKGTYIYSHNELFSNYDNKGGQYIQTNIDVEHNTTELGYAFGKIIPLASNTSRLWNISYHIQAYSSNTDYNSEYDVYLYGYDNTILGYCTFNAVGAFKPYLNHIIIKENNSIKVGLSFIADNIDRKISIIINDYRNCIFEQISEPNIVVEGLNVILFDAITKGLVTSELSVTNTAVSGTANVSTANITNLQATTSTLSNVTISSATVSTMSVSTINGVTVGDDPKFTDTDEKVKQSSSTTNQFMPILGAYATTPTSGNSGQAYYNQNIAINTATNTIKVNACQMTYDAAEDCMKFTFNN